MQCWIDRDWPVEGGRVGGSPETDLRHLTCDHEYISYAGITRLIHSSKMASGKVDGHSVERGPSHVSVVPLEVAVQFLVAYYLTSFYPKTSFLYAIWLLKVAQVYVLKTSSSASSAKMSQANGKEIDAEALNSTDESNFKNKSCFLVDIGETNCCSGVKTDTEKINKREIASKSKFLLEVPSKFLNSTKSRSGSAPTILEIRTALEELGCIKCVDIEERNKDSVADATKMKGFDFKMFCVGQVQVGCNADEGISPFDRSNHQIKSGSIICILK